MKAVKWAALLAILWCGPALAGTITLFSDTEFRGDRLTLRNDVDNLAHFGRWNDRARSLVVQSGTWEVCKHAGYSKCRTLGPGTRLSNLGEIKYLGEISSLRELEPYGRGEPWNDRRWGDDRWGRDPWEDDPWDRPSPPPRRPQPGIIWNDEDDGRTGSGLSACQQRVYGGFVERFGHRGQANFTGFPDEGTIWWEGEAWRFRCSGGRINIWQ